MSANAGDEAVDAAPSENGASPSVYESPADLKASAPPMRPEAAVGAAFAGGFVLALLLRRVRS